VKHTRLSKKNHPLAIFDPQHYLLACDEMIEGGHIDETPENDDEALWQHYCEAGDLLNLSPNADFEPLYVRQKLNDWSYDRTALEIYQDASPEWLPVPSSSAEKDEFLLLSRLLRRKNFLEKRHVELLSGLEFATEAECALWYTRNLLNKELAPNSWFSPYRYAFLHKDVASSGLNPMYHCVVFSEQEHRHLPKTEPHKARVGKPYPALVEPELTHAAREQKLMLRISEDPAAIFAQSDGDLGHLASYSDCYIVGGHRHIIDADRGEIFHHELKSTAGNPGVEPKSCAISRYGTNRMGGKLQLSRAAYVPKCVNMMNEYDRNYFHFVVECLNTIYYLEKFSVPAEYTLLVSADLHTNFYELLDILLAGLPYRYLKIPRDHLFKADQVLELRGSAQILDIYGRKPLDEEIILDKPALAYIRTRVLNHFNRTPEPSDDIYLARFSGIRNLSNETEIIKALSSLDVVCHNFNRLPIAEQVRVVSRAKRIISATGASLTNLLWAPKECQVVVLKADHPNINTHFWNKLADTAGIEVDELIGARQYLVEGQHAVHDDFTINLEQLRHKLCNNI